MNCEKCGNETIKYGKSKNGKQKYRCKNCFSIMTEDKSFKWLTEEEKDLIIKMHKDKISITDIAKYFKRQYFTIYSFLQKKSLI